MHESVDDTSHRVYELVVRKTTSKAEKPQHSIHWIKAVSLLEVKNWLDLSRIAGAVEVTVVPGSEDYRFTTGVDIVLCGGKGYARYPGGNEVYELPVGRLTLPPESADGLVLYGLQTGDQTDAQNIPKSEVDSEIVKPSGRATSWMDHFVVSLGRIMSADHVDVSMEPLLSDDAEDIEDVIPPMTEEQMAGLLKPGRVDQPIWFPRADQLRGVDFSGVPDLADDTIPAMTEAELAAMKDISTNIETFYPVMYGTPMSDPNEVVKLWLPECKGIEPGEVHRPIVGMETGRFPKSTLGWRNDEVQANFTPEKVDEMLEKLKKMRENNRDSFAILPGYDIVPPSFVDKVDYRDIELRTMAYMCEQNVGNMPHRPAYSPMISFVLDGKTMDMGVRADRPPLGPDGKPRKRYFVNKHWLEQYQMLFRGWEIYLVKRDRYVTYEDSDLDWLIYIGQAQRLSGWHYPDTGEAELQLGDSVSDGKEKKASST